MFLTSGDVEPNRAVFADAGLDATVMLRDGSEENPFGALGTPSALLVGDDGRVVEPVVPGANAVPVFVAALAGAADIDATEPGSIRYVPAPALMCGQGGGGAGGDTDAVGTRVYAFGDFHVGIRHNSDATADVLDRLFPGATIDDPRAPDNYSVTLSTETAGPVRALDLLVRGSTQLVRSRSPRHVLEALIARVSADVSDADPVLVRAAATVFVADGRAVVLPPFLVDQLSRIQSRFTRAGLQLVDAPYATLDVDACELVVPEPSIAYDASVLDVLGGEQQPVGPGRYPVGAWGFVRSPDHVGVCSVATAVSSALPFLEEVDDLRGMVERLVHFFSQVPGVGLWYADLDDLVHQVVEMIQ